LTTDLVVPEAGALEADPVQYMAVVLHRAKGWLAEAQSIEQVRETKAVAVGYESVIREKELAFDAQLSATEIVRRCERRIGELVRQGQRDGTVLSRGQTVGDRTRGCDLRRPHEAVGVSENDRKAVSDAYAMADSPNEEFEEAISEAREEGNLSRANVVRKVKGEKPKTNDRSEWHHRRRRIDSNRILETLAQELDAAADGLDLMDPDDLDADLVETAVPAIKKSIATVNRHLRRIQHD